MAFMMRLGLARTPVGREIGAAAYGRDCHGLCAALRRTGHLCLGTVKERTAPVEHYRESRANRGQVSGERAVLFLQPWKPKIHGRIREVLWLGDLDSNQD